MAGARPGRWQPLDGRQVVTLALAFGIVSGLLEAARTVFGSMLRPSPTGETAPLETFWMAPLAASLTLLATGVLLLVVARLIRRPSLRAAAPLVFGFICAASFLRSLTGGLHPLAYLVLAAGVGAVVARAVARLPEPWLLWSRRVVVAGVVGLSLWALWVPRSRRLAEQRALAHLSDPAPDAPNVLLIVWDTVRALSMSLYGHERPTTPTLDSLAPRSVVFDRAVSTAPWTLPSHASLFTGLYEHEHGATHGSPLDDRPSTLAEGLTNLGYRTGGFAANTFWLGQAWGLHRGFQWYEAVWYDDSAGPGARMSAILLSWRATSFAYRRAGGRAARQEATKRVPAGTVNAAFLKWLDRSDQNRPFFAFLNLFEAHNPYIAPEPTGFRFSADEPLDRWGGGRPVPFGEDALEDLREAYDACIYHLDYRLGELLAALERRGALDNTMVIVTSDHGETIGEQAANLYGHAKFAYYDILHVPLVIYYPAKFEGVRYAPPVSLRDVPATVMNIVAGSNVGFPGVSLVPLVDRSGADGSTPSPALSQATPAEWHLTVDEWPVSKGPLFSLVEGDIHYIVNNRGEEQLFNVAEDVFETNSLADSAVYAPVLRRLREDARSMLGDRMVTDPNR